eukprot:899687-Prorocentrum_minimum.AAC.1
MLREGGGAPGGAGGPRRPYRPSSGLHFPSEHYSTTASNADEERPQVPRRATTLSEYAYRERPQSAPRRAAASSRVTESDRVVTLQRPESARRAATNRVTDSDRVVERPQSARRLIERPQSARRALQGNSKSPYLQPPAHIR